MLRMIRRLLKKYEFTSYINSLAWQRHRHSVLFLSIQQTNPFTIKEKTGWVRATAFGKIYRIGKSIETGSTRMKLENTSRSWEVY